MEKGVNTVIGVGIGLGIAYVTYKLYSSRLIGHTVEKPRSKFFSKPKVRPVTLQRLDERISKVSDIGLEKIEAIEKHYFTEVSDLLTLNQAALQKVNQFLLARWLVDEKDLPQLNTFGDILEKLHEHKVLGPVNYSDVVQCIFQEIGQKVPKKVLVKLEMLRDAVMDHIVADIQGQTSEAWNKRSKKVDILILHSENDYREADKLKNDICHHASVNDLQIMLFDEFVPGGQVYFRAFEEAMEACICIFLLVTPTFAEDGLKRFLGQTGLITDLQSSESLWRIVPVWMDSDMQEPDRCPFELSAFQGMKYYRYIEDNKDTNCFKAVNRLITMGRKKEMDRFEARRLQD